MNETKLIKKVADRAAYLWRRAKISAKTDDEKRAVDMGAIIRSVVFWQQGLASANEEIYVTEVAKELNRRPNRSPMRKSRAVAFLSEETIEEVKARALLDYEIKKKSGLKAKEIDLPNLVEEATRSLGVVLNDFFPVRNAVLRSIARDKDSKTKKKGARK